MADHYEDLELSRAWNELTETGIFASTDLDPETSKLLLRLDTSANAPMPGAARERVWLGLRDTYAKTVSDKEPTMLIATDLIRPALNGRISSPRPLIVDRPRSRDRRLLLAIAAVLVVAMIGGTAGVIRNERNDPGSLANGPAIHAPGTPSPEAESTDQVLVEVDLPADTFPPGETVSAALGRLTLPVGEFSYPAGEGASNPGVKASHVLEGTVSIVSGETMQVISGGNNGRAADVPAGATIVLSPGDTLLTRKSDAEVWTNNGPAEAKLIAMDLLGGPLMAGLYPNGWVENDGDLAEGTVVLPDSPIRLRLLQVTVAPDTSLTPPPGSLAFLAIPLHGESMGKASDGSITFLSDQLTTAFVMTVEAAKDTATPAS